MARVLIADDEDLERKAIRFILESSSTPGFYVIDEARNGLEALELAVGTHPDAIFLDIRMPGLDGLKAAERMRTAGCEAPIIILSAFDTFEYAQKAIRLGVYEYLLKPAGTEEVLSALARSLEAGKAQELISKKQEASLSAISSVSSKLEETLRSQAARGALDEDTVREYEKLISHGQVKRAVIALRVSAENLQGVPAVAKALLRQSADIVEKNLAVKCSRMLNVLTDDFCAIIIYGLQEEPDRETAGGFRKTMKSDPLWAIAEPASKALRDKAPAELFCGFAGPSASSTSILFAQAIEAVGLASHECPVIRMESGAGEGEDNLPLAKDGRGESSRTIGMRALSYIKDNYSGELALIIVAEALGVSPFHLSHAVSKELGIGFSELVNRVRINKAKELIRGGASIKESSYLVGFSDQAYFTRVFKKLEGQNPRQFVEKTAKKYKETPKQYKPAEGDSDEYLS